MTRSKFIRRAILLLVTIAVANGICAQRLDSLQADRLVMRCVQYGVGYTNLYDTYLSEREYRGIDFRLARETMRLMSYGNGHISEQNYLQTNFSLTHNAADNNNTLAALVNWNYGQHYQFRISDNLKLLAGAVCDMNLGFVYNLRNSNNPASLRAFINLDASGMAIWHFKLKNHPMILRYQLNIPFVGVLFSPEMGESYYEIFSLGNGKNTIKCTTPFTQPSLRQWISLDVPIRDNELRFTYLADIEQSHVNHIKTHTYSHVFMVGFVRHFYVLGKKEKRQLPSSLQVY